jgi:hypothetical protein
MINNTFYLNLVALNLLLILIMSGCATAMYTPPKALNFSKKQYEFFIETGPFTSIADADLKAKEEIKRFMTYKKFNSYNIVYRYESFLPAGFKYQVEFR